MKLSQGTLRPGRVIEVLENGEIRAAAPGLFSEQDKDQLPPILPFPSWHANTYSAPKIGDEVWVLNFMDNPLQLHWFRKDNYKENLGDIIKEENVDVSKYAPGQRVYHKKFGEGVINKIEPEGDDVKVDISFDKSGNKRLMAKFAGLEII
jgi:hypothetical protein